MKNIKNLIWDFDGTLFDTYPAITRSFQRALSDLGHDMPLSLFYGMVRVSLDHTLSQLNALFQVDETALQEHFYTHYAAVAPEAQPPFGGAREVCELIKKQGGKNFLVTHRRKASAVKLLEHYSMAELFCDRIYRDEGYRRKPDPEMFDLLINRHKLMRSETLAIGDRDLDIGAGKAAGVRTCLYVKIEEALKGSDVTICDYRLLIKEMEEGSYIATVQGNEKERSRIEEKNKVRYVPAGLTHEEVVSGLLKEAAKDTRKEKEE